jgi:hypothetical protein
MSNSYAFFPNNAVDWLTNRRKITKTKRKDTFVTQLHCLNKFWQKGRRRAKKYEIFFHHFLPCVIKKTVFSCQVSVATNDRTICTVSNEAIALLLLENTFI